MIGLPEGARARFDLDGNEAFGARNPQLVQRVSRGLLARAAGPARVVGDVVQLPAPGGSGVLAATVRALGEDWVELDFNHPLAGVPLSFEVHVIGVL